jgi:hypothetical protein
MKSIHSVVTQPIVFPATLCMRSAPRNNLETLEEASIAPGLNKQDSEKFSVGALMKRARQGWSRRCETSMKIHCGINGGDNATHCPDGAPDIHEYFPAIVSEDENASDSTCERKARIEPDLARIQIGPTDV